MTTISAYLQLIRPGIDTAAHRHTHSTVYHVVRGSGYSIVDGERIDWVQGDTLAIPLWYEHSHHNPTVATMPSCSPTPTARRSRPSASWRERGAA